MFKIMFFLFILGSTLFSSTYTLQEDEDLYLSSYEDVSKLKTIDDILSKPSLKFKNHKRFFF